MSGSVVTARAAVLRSPGQPLSLEEVAVPSPGRGEVRVRMLATGVCRSDVSMAAGKIPLGRTDPFVLGHEGYGVVEDIGPEVSSLSPGAHVVLAAVPNCGHCWHCLHAEGALCDERAQHFPSRAQDKDGAPVWGLAGIGTFAEVTCVSASSVTEVRSTLPAAELALLGCAMLTGVGAVTKSAGVRHANAVVIVGCGGVGQVALQAARMVGAAPLIAIEPNSAKRELALSSGATHTLDPMAEDVIARVREITEGRGADHVIDFVATSATLGTSWTMTRRGGQLTVVGPAGKRGRSGQQLPTADGLILRSH
jgi:S-(hydroxymethyl)glutathione dehydrogenase/alcohol dehydrogenase